MKDAQITMFNTRFNICRYTDVYKVGVDVVGTVHASDWLQTDA